MEQFIKCFSEEDYEKILKLGHKFLYEQNNVYWFSINTNANFTFSQDENIELTSVINM